MSSIDNYKVQQEDESAKATYLKKNKDFIKELQKKKEDELENELKLKKKEEEIREKLRKKILEEAAKLKEKKNQDTSENQEQPLILPPIDNKAYQISQEELKQKEQLLKEYDTKIQEEKNKLKQFYRSRYASFLQTLKENQLGKKEIEENEKKKKEVQLQKIREEMGLNSVDSKVYNIPKKFDLPQIDLNSIRSHSLDSNEEKNSEFQKQIQKQLFEKQKQLLTKISEKKQEEKLKKQMEQKRKEDLITKLKNKIIDQEKAQAKSLFNKTTSDSIKALNIDTPVKTKEKKSKTQKLTKTFSQNLPDIKQKNPNIVEESKEEQEEDDYEDQIEKGNSSKQTTKKRKEKTEKKKYLVNSNITDLEVWKKKNKLDPSTKVYIIMGGYNTLKKSLDERGWVENPDSNSPCFDLKWTLKSKDIDHDYLQDFQIVNHFPKNACITTKVGLCKSLRNLIWFNNVDIDTFYPRCFDLNDVHEYEDFIQEFKSIKAEAILKQFVRQYQSKDPNAAKNELRASVALRVCERRLRDLDDLIDEKNPDSWILVHPQEWDILATDELDQAALAKKKHEEWFAKLDKKYNSGQKTKKNNDQSEEGKKKKKKKTRKESDPPEQEEEEEKNDKLEVLYDNCKEVLEELEKKFPQYFLNGEKNVWIVKPAGLSRGRGITCLNNLVEIQDYTKGKEMHWIAQKYIERPLIIKNRKFDIRQWVMVTDWNPLCVWVYEEPYIRFSAENYKDSDLTNKFIHLTNNSIVKYSKHFNNSEIEGNMWFAEDFQNYLKEKEGRDIFNEEIKPKIKQIVIWSLESVQDMFDVRKNSVELYGYDFMVDEKNNVWLIEINSSPAMDYSTHITKKLVQLVLADTAKVIVDYAMNKNKKKKKDIDTGLFTCVYKGKIQVDKPLNSLGLNLVCEGKAIQNKLLFK